MSHSSVTLWQFGQVKEMILTTSLAMSNKLIWIFLKTFIAIIIREGTSPALDVPVDHTTATIRPV